MDVKKNEQENEDEGKEQKPPATQKSPEEEEKQPEARKMDSNLGENFIYTFLR